ncbi:MAG: hypothetical protein PHR96_00140 [Clostridia bacterium]|nr:hypothetical protein [Clostridia bacterium]
MIRFNKGMQKLIASGLVIIFCCITLFAGILAILSNTKMGLSVNVSFDSAVTAKVYLATNSNTDINFKQPNDSVTAENFAKPNSAIIFNTYNIDTNGGKTKTSFEQLGANEDLGLKCDANGEMEFYVYVENYSTTEIIYYRANIDFVGTGEQSAPFSTATNPFYETADTAVEVNDPSISLLTFKISSDNATGITANAIRIEIDLQTELPWEWLGVTGKYTSGSYNGLYYVDFGEYPQSLYGTTQPTGTIYNSTSGYYENLETGKKYELYSTKYYNVEPVRWLVIGNGNNYNNANLGFPNINSDNLASNQLLLFSEKIIAGSTYGSGANVLWTNVSLYSTLSNMKDKMFSPETNLGTFDDGSQLSILSSTMLSYKYSNYYSGALALALTCTKTSWATTIGFDLAEYYWLRRVQTSAVFSGYTYTDGARYTTGAVSEIRTTYVAGIRPIIILNV